VGCFGRPKMRSGDAKMRARENDRSLDARSAAQKGAAEWRRDKPSEAWKKPRLD